MVELMGFFNRAFPDHVKDEAHPSTDGPSLPESSEHETVGETQSVQTDVAAEFHCLNFLLVRDENRVGSQSFGPPVGRKVASVCLNDLCLHASVGRQIEVTGSVEGVEVLDQTPQGWLHREIFKIGVVPGRESKLKSEEDDEDGPQRAFSFELVKQTETNQSIEKVTVTAQLAALHYLHTWTFLNELQLCASDFRHFTLELATSLRTAAAGVAMGIVGQKETPKGGFDLSKAIGSRYVDQTDGLLAEDTFDGSGEVDVSIKVFLRVGIGSPVVLLPRGSDSGEMFIAHLGHITASNSFVTEDLGIGEVDRLAVTVKDMHLFSCVINTEGWQEKSSMDVALNSNNKTEILHDTTIELTIDRPTKPAVSPIDDFSPSSTEEGDGNNVTPTKTPLFVNGKVTTPLKVTLSKPVFKRALATLDFVTGDKNKDTSDGSLSISDSTQVDVAPATNDQESDFHPLVASFTIPNLSLILRGIVASNQGDMLTDERDIVEVSLEHFSLRAQKHEQFVTELELKLRGLLVDDLIQTNNTKHHHIISSYVGPGHGSVPRTVFPPMQRPFGFRSLSQQFLKQSVDVFHSLPAASSSPIGKRYVIGSSARSGEVFASPIGKVQIDRDRPLEHWKELDLVNVKVVLVDKLSPKFAPEYESVSRFVDVDFNVLSAVVNLQTWVILFDFFGIGVPDQMNVSASGSHVEESSSKGIPLQPTVGVLPPDKPDMNVNVHVNALTLTLNKSQYPLAEASVLGLEATVLSRREKNCVSGRLESLCLSDISANGDIYRERY